MDEAGVIAVQFDQNSRIPLISGGSGDQEKVLYELKDVRILRIYYVNQRTEYERKIGQIRFRKFWKGFVPQEAFTLRIAYEEGEDCCHVAVPEQERNWSFPLKKKPSIFDPPEGWDPGESFFLDDSREEEMPLRTVAEHPERCEEEHREYYDKERLRNLEEAKDIHILWPDELFLELEREIKGQDAALKKISEMISANLRRKHSEVETILLFGPTGVGKTRTGQILPKALTKLTHHTYGFCQIALNEFTEAHSVNRFFGSPPSYVGYKEPTVFEPVRKNPYQVYLLDEVEKSHPKILEGLMECFSTGVVHLADNSPDIDIRHVIFILTSNLPVPMENYCGRSSFEQKELCRDVLTKATGRPEIAGKIQNCLAFEPLSSGTVTDLVIRFLKEELDNFDIELGFVDEALLFELKKQQSRYGARGLRDLVREALSGPMLYDHERIYEGKRVALSGTLEDIRMKPMEPGA